MNRAALHYLRGVLGDIPVAVRTVPHNRRLAHAAEMFLGALGVRGHYLMRAGDVGAVMGRGRVRVVAGKGRRRRGVRGRR